MNPTHFLQLSDIVVHEDMDICCVQETFTKAEHNMLDIPNYKILRCDRPTHGGGVAIMYKREHTCKIINQTEFDNSTELHQTEYMIVSAKVGNRKPFIILKIYRPPYSTNVKGFQRILKAISDVTKPNQINFNLLVKGKYFDASKNIQKYYELMTNMNFSQLVKEPTRNNNLIDHVWTNSPSDSSVTVFEPHVSDHKAIKLIINLKKQKLPKKTYTYRDYKSINVELFMDTMSNLNLVDTVSENPLYSWNNWLNRIIPVLYTLIPQKTKTITSYPNKKYLSHDTLQLKHMRDQAYRKYSKNKTDCNKVTVKALNSQVNKAIQHDTKHYINNEIDRRGFWSGISSFVRLKSSKQVEPLNLDQPALELINKFYADIGNPIRNTTTEENQILEDKDKWGSLFKPFPIYMLYICIQGSIFIHNVQ